MAVKIQKKKETNDSDKTIKTNTESEVKLNQIEVAHNNLNESESVSKRSCSVSALDLESLEQKLTKPARCSQSNLLLLISVEEDMLLHIVMNLDALSLMSMELVCKQFRHFIIQKNIWQKLSEQLARYETLDFELKQKVNHVVSADAAYLKYKKVIIKYDRIVDNLKKGEASYREYYETKADFGIGCNSCLLVVGQHEGLISVYDRKKEDDQSRCPDMQWKGHTEEVSWVGLAQDKIFTFASDEKKENIKVWKLVFDEELIIDVEFVTEILPTKANQLVKDLFLSEECLAVSVTTYKGAYVDNTNSILVYDVGKEDHPKLLCELKIPQNNVIVSSNWNNWQTIDINNDKVYVILFNKNSKMDKRIMIWNVDGSVFGVISGLLGFKDKYPDFPGGSALKVCDGFVYLVTRRKIQVLSEIEKKSVMSKQRGEKQQEVVHIAINKDVFVVTSGNSGMKENKLLTHCNISQVI